MSRNPSGGIDVSVRVFQNGSGMTRVIEVLQSYLQLADADLLMGLFVQAAIRQVYTDGEEKQKLVKLIIDLDQVRRITMDILPAFTQAAKSSKEFGVTLVVCRAQPGVKSILNRTPIDQLVRFVETLEEAHTL